MDYYSKYIKYKKKYFSLKSGGSQASEITNEEKKKI